MSSRLVLKYRFDPSYFDQKLVPDSFGRLSVSVTTDRFSGNGGFWVQWQDVKEFGEALNVYPILKDSPVVVQWGLDMQVGDDLILRLEIAPENVRGDLKVNFEIADDFAPQERVRGSFLTNYPELESFRLDIAKLMDSLVDEAVLLGQ